MNIIWTLRCLSYRVSCSALQWIPFQLALPACTWPFCLSTLIFLLISSETPTICRLPLPVVSYPEENRRYQRQLKASEKAQQSQHSSSQEEAPLKENGVSKTQLAGEKCCSESVWVEEMLFLFWDMPLVQGKEFYSHKHFWYFLSYITIFVI